MNSGHITIMTLPELALQLDAGERTLRRAVDLGTVHVGRPSPRKLALAPSEWVYCQDHWQTLQQLRAALRTERWLALAVVFGSYARGDDGTDSDIDLVVLTARPRSALLAHNLSQRLSKLSGRTVQITDLRSAERSPFLLADIAREGRPLIDRGDHWAALQQRLPAIEATERRRVRQVHVQAQQTLRRFATT